MSTHKSVCTEIHWSSGMRKVQEDVLEEAQLFSGIQSWSMIHNAYQT